MYHINRGVTIIRPKQPFVDWANGLPDAAGPVTVDDLRDDALAVLIPNSTDEGEAKEFVGELAEDLFEYEFSAWWTDDNDWP